MECDRKIHTDKIDGTFFSFIYCGLFITPTIRNKDFFVIQKIVKSRAEGKRKEER